MNINLHIERLVLDGLPITHSQSLLVQQAVEAELSRLLSTGELSRSLLQGAAVPNLQASNINWDNASHPTQLGQQIAQSIYGGIKP